MVPAADPLRDAFDAHSADYDRTWGADPVAGALRERVHAVLDRVLPRRGAVLDLGCGTGVDAARLAGRGLRVFAVDAARGMVDATARRCAGLPVEVRQVDLASPETLPEGPFDGALSDFGVLNCMPLAPVAAALARRMRPGAPFVLVVMSHRCPAETLALLVQGHPVEAWRRRRRGTAPVAGVQVPIAWLSPEAVIAGLGPAFEVAHVEALGAVLPPPGRTGARLHPLLPLLAPVDRVVGRWPLLRRWGDHTLVVARRR